MRIWKKSEYIWRLYEKKLEEVEEFNYLDSIIAMCLQIYERNKSQDTYGKLLFFYLERQWITNRLYIALTKDKLMIMPEARKWINEAELYKKSSKLRVVHARML